MKLTIAMSAVAVVLLLTVPMSAWGQSSIEVTATSSEGGVVSGTATASGGGRSGSCRLTAGRCVIRGLPPGRYVVTVAPQGGVSVRRTVNLVRSPVSASFVVRSATIVRPPSVKIGPAGSKRIRPGARITPSARKNLASGARVAVQGTATFARGTPASGVIDVRRGGVSVGYVDVRTGRFSIFDLTPGRYVLTLTSPDRSPVTREVRVGTSFATVAFVVSDDAPSAPRKVLGHRISVGPAGSNAAARPRELGSGARLAVQGTATHARGTPAAGVIEARLGGTLVGTSRVVTGRFSLFDLSPGRYTVTFRPDQGSPQARTVTVTTTFATIAFVVP